MNKGSVFTLSIPASPVEALPLRIEEDGQLKRVLLIDDDETSRYVLRQIVSNEPRYRFLEARDGEEGLKLARAETPDIVVLDLQMPAVDGFTVFQELSADPRTSSLAIVVLTSLTINSGLTSRFPAGTRIVSKDTISREIVSSFLREAASAPR